MNTIQLSNGATIALAKGDITTFSADAVVNAANAYLAAGGGVSGAIHAAAGPELKEECDAIALDRGPLNVSDTVTTRGYRLPARFVIHVLGPVWYGAQGEAEALERAYANVVSAADLLALSSIALPSVSTGIFGYPVEQAAPIAVSAVAQGLSASQHVRSATFVLFDDATYDAFASAIGGFSAR